MAINVGYLTCGRDSESDEVMTPMYAVQPLLKYITNSDIIWCPFDKEWSAFVQTFRANGNKVIYSHLEDGKDFFAYEPQEKYDFIISNPPFSKKHDVLKRLDKLNKPFAILLPLNSLQGQSRFKIFQKGIELLAFDKRIDYHTNGDLQNYRKGNHFASAYFCRGILPEKLIIECLEKYEHSLI